MANQIKEKVPIVIDNGSGVCKTGFAEEDYPRFTIQTSNYEPEEKHIFQDGNIQDWDEMIKVWKHVFENDLKINPTEHSVLITESSLTPKTNREKMTEIMFETFHVSGLFIANPCVLSLYASGRTTGMVLDSGESITQIVPVYEGYAIDHAIHRVNLGGRKLTTYLDKTLIEQYKNPEISQKIKETKCYVSVDYKNEPEKEEIYKLPDGQVITLNSELYRCPEILFQPEIIEMQSPGVHELIFKAITKSNLDIRKNLYGNIILAGGSTVFPGMVDRIKLELTKLAPVTMDLKIIAPTQRIYSVWIGGSLLAGLNNFQEMWIKKKDFEEFGPQIAHKKCF